MEGYIECRSKAKVTKTSLVVLGRWQKYTPSRIVINNNDNDNNNNNNDHVNNNNNSSNNNDKNTNNNNNKIKYIMY